MVKDYTIVVNEIINHIAIVIDASGSMHRLTKDVVTVADGQVSYLAQRSTELDQETRATVYTFDSVVTSGGYAWESRDHRPRIQCVYYDKDVLRMPSLKGKYNPEGGTPLIDATLKAIDDLQKTATLYGDHAFLLYVLTDGFENTSRNTPRVLREQLLRLPDNWTVAVLVPNSQSVFEAKKLGFSPDNIAIWDTTSQGIAEVGKVIRQATDNFMQARASGVRSTKSLFVKPDVSGIDVSRLTELKVLVDYYPFEVSTTDNLVIRPFVESKGVTYTIGNTYYQLTKPEDVQASKKVVIEDLDTDKVYYGDARTMLGIPGDTVRVHPTDFGHYNIFVQSTSVNRKLVPDTKVLVLR